MNCFKYTFCAIACIFLLNISFSANLQANFGSDIQVGCTPLNVQFYDSSTIDFGNITAWRWDFGDGYTSTLQHPAHIYQIPGSYDVSLTVTGNSGDTSHITKLEYIFSAVVPEANFIPNPSLTTLDKPIITFENRTLNETVNTQYKWNFSDKEQFNPGGGTSKVKSPIYKYSDTGLYNVILIAYNQYGCFDTMFRQVAVLMPCPDLITFLSYPFYTKLGFISKPENYYPVYVCGKIYSLEVFDLYGQRVFTSDKYCKGWTGYYMPNGKFTPNGFYIVRLRYLRYDNTWQEIIKKVFLVNTAK